MPRARFYLIGFLVLLAFDTLSQLSFKYAAIHAAPLEFGLDWMLRVLDHPWIYGAVLGYLGAFFAYMTMLRHAPIGPAFAASHLEVVAVMALSVPLFGEHLSCQQLFGAVLIVSGVICLAFSETTQAHP